MSDDPKAIVSEYLEYWNDRDPDGMETVLADDLQATGLPGGMETTSIDAYRAFVSDTLAAFPDMSWTIDELLSEGDHAAAVVTATGTHEGTFMGIEPTGNEMRIEGNLVFRIADGKIQRKWTRMDELGMLQQVGVLPEDLAAVAPPADD